MIGALERFCSPEVKSDSIFILNGYAGTGKTSLTGAMVQALKAENIPVVLLAPTGRAAKVFSQNARQPAYTIHRRIYHASIDPSAGMSHLLRENSLENAVFIVDEASMIPDQHAIAQGQECSSLLDDLLEYVFSGVNCKLVLLGDVAQLPPVGSDKSPALDAGAMKSRGFHVSMAQLTSIARQQHDSAILKNATWQRQVMRLPGLPSPIIAPGKDVKLLASEDLEELLSHSYRDQGPDSTIIVTRNNWRATSFNQAVRNQVLDCEEELQVAERLIVVKNNYTWGAKSKKIDFIANGDMATVTHIYGYEELHGFRFADVTLYLPDSEVEIDCKIILDALNSNSPAVEPVRFQDLVQARLNQISLQYPQATYDYWLRKLRADDYFNALQVKYAYAVTCHKAQGGQWPNVVVDMGGIDLDCPSLEFYRWLYTATTRASNQLYFLNVAAED